MFTPYSCEGCSLDSYDMPEEVIAGGENLENEDAHDLSRFLDVEATEMEVPNHGNESDEDYAPDQPLICKICFVTFKTKSGWRNHKVIHQKFRMKEFACYICYRMFYWDKDCRRHIKNIHGEENYNKEESRKAARSNQKTNRIVYHQPSLNHQDYHHLNQQNQLRPKPSQKNHQNSQSSQMLTQNNNVFKMKIELLKSHEKKTKNNSNKETYSEYSMRSEETPTNAKDCFFNNDYHNSNYVKNSGNEMMHKDDCSIDDKNNDVLSTYTIHLSEETTIENHILKAQDDLKELLDDVVSSDESFIGIEDAFETVDPDLCANEHTPEFDLESSNSNGGFGSVCSNVEVISYLPQSTSFDQNFKVNYNLKVDMHNFVLPQDIVIEPKSDSDLFLSKRTFKCSHCPRKFINDEYLKIHEKSC